MVVGNRFRDEPDHPGLAPAARIPFDPQVAEAERQGLARVNAVVALRRSRPWSA